MKAFIFCLIYVLALFVANFIHGISQVCFSYGNGGITTIFIESAFLLPSVALSAIIIDLNNEQVLRYIGVVSLLSIVSSLFFILPVMLADASVARLYSEVNVASSTVGADVIAKARFFWNYPMIHAIAMLVPAFFACYKGLTNQTKAKYYFLLCAAAVIITVIQSSIATIFFYVLFFLLFYINNTVTKKKLLLIIFETVLFVVLYFYISDILMYLIDYFEDSAMSSKFEDFLYMLKGEDDANGSVSVRHERHTMALEAFLNNPLLGTKFDVSGHSFILNRLASVGIMGMIPFTLFLFFQYKSIKPLFQKSDSFFINWIWLGAIILLYSKGLFGSEGFIMLLVITPCIISIKKSYEI